MIPGEVPLSDRLGLVPDQDTDQGHTFRYSGITLSKLDKINFAETYNCELRKPKRITGNLSGLLDYLRSVEDTDNRVIVCVNQKDDDRWTAIDYHRYEKPKVAPVAPKSAPSIPQLMKNIREKLKGYW